MNTRFYIRPSMDVPNCYNVYDRETINHWGKDYCVDSHITHEEAIRLCEYLNAGKVTPENPYPAGVLSYADDIAQAANDAAGEAAYNEAVAEYNEAVAAVHELQTENNKLEKDARDFAQFYNQERAKRVTVETDNATLRQQLAERDNRIEELDAAIIRYRDYALQLQYALKRAGLSIEVDNVPVPDIDDLQKQLADAQAENAELKQMLSRREAFVYRIRAAETFEAVRELLQEDHLRGLAEMFDLEFNPQPAPVPVADAPQPLAEVTLTEDEIDELARVVLSTDPMRFDGSAVVFSDTVISKVTSYYRESWQFEHEYDTPANREAIAARRKQLGL